MGALICYPNRADAATLAGGSWLSSMPLTNMQDRRVWLPARSTDDAEASTQVTADLGAAYPIRMLGVAGHNFSLAANYRWSGQAISTGDPDYSSGWLAAFPAIYPSGTEVWGDDRSGEALSAEDWADGRIKYAVPLILSAALTYRYWKLEVSDVGNVSGGVDIGKLLIMQAWAPGRRFSRSAVMDGEGGSQRFPMPYGGASYQEEQVARVESGVFEGVLNDDAMVAVAEQLRLVVGSTRQVYYVQDETATHHLQRTSFLGVLRKPSSITMPYGTAADVAVEIVEEL